MNRAGRPPASRGARPLVSHFGLYAVGTGVVAAAGLIVVPIYARVLGPSAYGAYEAIATLVQFMTAVLILGLDSALAMTMHRNGADRRTLVVSALVIAASAGIAAAILFGIAAPMLATAVLRDDAATTPLAVGAVAIAPGVVYAVASAALRNALVPGAFVRAAVAYSVTLAGVGAGAVLLGAGTTGAALGLACGATAGAAVAVASLRMPLTLRAASRGSVGSLLAIGVPIVPAAIFAWIIAAGDRLILVALTDTTQVGLYAAAVKVALGAGLLVSAGTLAWTPFALSIQNRLTAPQSYAAALHAYIALAAAVLVAVSPFSGALVTLIAGPEYRSAASVVWLLLAGTLAYGAYLVMLIGVQLARRPWIVSVTTGLAAVVNVVGNLLLIPHLGFYGAGVATLVAYVISAAALFVAAQRVHRLPYRTLGIAIVATVALSVAAVTAAGILPTPLAVGLVVLVSLGCGALGIHDAQHLRRHLRDARVGTTTGS